MKAAVRRLARVDMEAWPDLVDPTSNSPEGLGGSDHFLCIGCQHMNHLAGSIQMPRIHRGPTLHFLTGMLELGHIACAARQSDVLADANYSPSSTTGFQS